ncbi:MAG: multicopper oxidase family protein [Acidimicrobiia bacterium]
MTVTRRQFLGRMTQWGTGVGAGAVLLGSGLPRGIFAQIAAATPSAVADFTQPEFMESAGGTLDVTLVARARRVPWGAGTRYALTFNGTTPGPTLVVRPGDRVRLTLVNELDDDTNLHTHGLYVSPSGSHDNVFVTVPAGERHTYTYDITPEQRSATAWYHPHMHGMVAPQVAGGLAGAIVIRDDLDTDPSLAGATERVMVLSDPKIGKTAAVLDVSMMQKMQGRQGDGVLVNGVARPTIGSTAGTLEHWRFVNASASRYYRLVLDGLPMSLVGTDGGRLAAPAQVEEVHLAPGERAEVLVAPTKAGTYALRTLAVDRGSLGMGMGGGSSIVSPASRVATLAVSGDAPAAALPSTIAAASTLDPGRATGSRDLTLAMGMGGGNGGGMGGMGGGGGGMAFTIDGKTFDPSVTNIRTRLGRVEDWTITNTSAMDHPFHLHVWPFRVIERSDGPPEPGWKDTVNVPAGGSVTVRVPFDRVTGRTVYHCHILDHEDLGMMGVIRVDPATT